MMKGADYFRKYAGKELAFRMDADPNSRTTVPICMDRSAPFMCVTVSHC